jgi:plastocyanin
MFRRPVALVSLVLVLAGCAATRPRPSAVTRAVTDDHGVQRVDVDLHSYYFDPQRIEVRSGRPVELVVHNRALVVPHNFTIADSGLDVSVSAWGPGGRTVRFTPTVPGEYRFFCHVGSHAMKGMTGTLVVLP